MNSTTVIKFFFSFFRKVYSRSRVQPRNYLQMYTRMMILGDEPLSLALNFPAQIFHQLNKDTTKPEIFSISKIIYTMDDVKQVVSDTSHSTSRDTSCRKKFSSNLCPWQLQSRNQEGGGAVQLLCLVVVFTTLGQCDILL